MTDIDIIRLLWIRDEIAIEELEINYGHYCKQISWEIVQNREDVSDLVENMVQHSGKQTRFASSICRKDHKKFIA